MATARALLPTVASAVALLLFAAPGVARHRAPEPIPLSAAPPGARGTFQDALGKRHSWTVNAAFALTWDGAPYLPVGVAFSPRSLAEPDDPSAWGADKETLRSLKAAGVTDVWMAATHLARNVPVSTWQRLVDLLEAEGFCYGLALPATLPSPVAGYYLGNPAFRSDPITGSGECALLIQIPGYSGELQRVAAVVLDADTGALLRVDWAKLVPTTQGVRASISLNVPPGERHVVAMVPFLTGTTGLPDVWGGLETAQESLRPFSALKFGPGLRFLLHPYSGILNLDGPGGYLVPTSENHRLEFEAFLSRRYARIETLRERWAFRGGDPASFQVAARLVPLVVVETKEGKAGYLLDEKERRCYTIAIKESSFWYDYLSFREQSLREHFQLIAQAMRQQIADVPVVVQRSGQMRRVYVNDQPVTGFAGIGIHARDINLLAQAGFAIGECRQATTRPWCLALALEGYRTKESLLAALELLRQIGMKGWFVSLEGSPPETPSWLAEFRASLLARSDAADYRPHYVLYPHPTQETGAFGIQHPTVEAETRPVARHAWWIPTLPDRVWHVLDVGEGLCAYGMQTERGYEICLWAPKEKRRIHLRPPAFAVVEVYDPAGKLVKRHRGADRLRLDLGPEPLTLLGMNPEFLVPIEVAEAELRELERLVKEMKMRQGHTEVLQDLVALARRLDPDRRPRDVRNLVRPKLDSLRQMLESSKPATPSPTPPSNNGSRPP